MQLAEYIRDIGVPEFAKRFRVSERAATSYLYGARMPRAGVARRIVSGSPVTWDGIYGQTNGKRRRKNGQ